MVQAVQARLLRALEYPFVLEVASPESVATLVSWCEDRKIRLLEIEERGPLRVASSAWDAVFQRYLGELECPVSWPEHRSGCISWLLHKAAECEFEDDEAALVRDAERGRGRGSRSDDADAIRRAATALGVDHLPVALDDVLVACSARVAAANDAQTTVAAPSSLAFPLGFTTGDAYVDEVAQRMRLSYVDDLRDLQDAITGIIVRAQNFVANPVTNAGLGKVGR